jgi:hypothetical protein
MARATARVNAAMARVSLAEDALRVANERLALAYLALQYVQARDAHDSPQGEEAERSEREEDDSGAARSAG